MQPHRQLSRDEIGLLLSHIETSMTKLLTLGGKQLSAKQVKFVLSCVDKQFETCIKCGEMEYHAFDSPPEKLMTEGNPIRSCAYCAKTYCKQCVNQDTQYLMICSECETGFCHGCLKDECDGENRSLCQECGAISCERGGRFHTCRVCDMIMYEKFDGGVANKFFENRDRNEYTRKVRSSRTNIELGL